MSGAWAALKPRSGGGGPVGFSDGGNRRDWFPGGCGRPKRRPNGDVILINALTLAAYSAES
jgi:hypothetical protein